MGVMKTVMYSIYTLDPLRVEIPKLSTYTHHLSKGIPMLVLYLFYSIYNEDFTKKNSRNDKKRMGICWYFVFNIAIWVFIPSKDLHTHVKAPYYQYSVEWY
jgi:hypothetical protein